MASDQEAGRRSKRADAGKRPMRQRRGLGSVSGPFWPQPIIEAGGGQGNAHDA